MLLAEGRELFLQSLQHAEGRSINTITGYRSLLKRYERYLAVQGMATTVEHQSAALLQGYLTAMGTAGNKHSTIDHAYTVISSFFAWAVRSELLHRNPARAFRRKRAPRPLPRAVDPAVVLTQVAEMKRTRFRCIDSRDRVAVMVMLFSGARVSEVCALTWADVLWDRGLLAIPQTKGGDADHRLVPLSSVLRDELARHRAAVSATFPNCQWVVQSRAGRRICKDDVSQAFRNRGWVGPHVLRHTYATMLLRAAVNVRRIQSYMGHRSLDTTARYLALLSDDAASDSEPIDAVFSRLRPRHVAVGG